MSTNETVSQQSVRFVQILFGNSNFFAFELMRNVTSEWKRMNSGIHLSFDFQKIFSVNFLAIATTCDDFNFVLFCFHERMNCSHRICTHPRRPIKIRWQQNCLIALESKCGNWNVLFVYSRTATGTVANEVNEQKSNENNLTRHAK